MSAKMSFSINPQMSDGTNTDVRVICKELGSRNVSFDIFLINLIFKNSITEMGVEVEVGKAASLRGRAEHLAEQSCALL